VKSGRSHSPPKPKRRVGKLVGCLLFLVVLALGGWLISSRRVLPPVVSLASIDPALRSTIETSRIAVVEAPRSGLAWGKLGEAFHAAEFTPEAKLCYSNAALHAPEDFRWPYLLGTLEQQGEPLLSIQHLTRATELAAGRVDSPRYQLARTLVEQGQVDQAEPHLRLLLAANPYHAAASLELARVQLARGALRDATRTLQPALTNDYTMHAGYLLGSQIAQRNNQADVAAQLSRRAAALARTFDWPDPVLREVQSMRKDRAYLADQVNGYLQQFKLPETETALNKLLSTFPDDSEGLLLLGRLRYVQKRCAEAEAAYRRHLGQQPDSLNGLIQLGLALMCQEQWNNAVSVLEQAVTLKPDFAQAHSNLGIARSKAGDGAGAIRAFRDALRCNPGDINAHMSLAEELANANEIEEAKQQVQSAAALNPNDARVLRAREQLGIK